MSEKIKRKYGWKRQKQDERDFKAGKPSFLRKLTLPTIVDLRPKDGPIENQGSLGSCTGHALAGALQFLELKNGDPVDPYSRLFIYFNERLEEGTTDEDAGADIRDGIKTLAKYGVCSETYWPYIEDKFKDRPPLLAYQKAKPVEISEYKSLSTLMQIKSVLASGYPVVFGIIVYDSFESEEVAKNGIVPMPGKDDGCIGGHAVTMVGYDDNKKCVIVRNSWGTDWGDKGYFYLPYDYVKNTDLSSDFWVIYK